MAYYLTFDELGEFIEQLKQALNPEGEILCCHWRHDIQDFELNAQKSIKAFNNLSISSLFKSERSGLYGRCLTVNPSSIAQREQLR